MLLIPEMVFWRRAAGRSSLESITNISIREIMDDIKNKQLLCFEDVTKDTGNKTTKAIAVMEARRKKKRT